MGSATEKESACAKAGVGCKKMSHLRYTGELIMVGGIRVNE